MCETIEHVCIVQLIHGVLTVIPGKVWLGLRYSCCTNSHPGKVWLGLTYLFVLLCIPLLLLVALCTLATFYFWWAAAVTWQWNWLSSKYWTNSHGVVCTPSLCCMLSVLPTPPACSCLLLLLSVQLVSWRAVEWARWNLQWQLWMWVPVLHNIGLYVHTYVCTYVSW